VIPLLLVSLGGDKIVELLPPVLLGLVTVSRLPASVVVRLRELRSLLSLADEGTGWVRPGLNSMIMEKFDSPLDGIVIPVPEVVAFAIRVVDMIDWDEFRIIIDRSVTRPGVVALDVLFRRDTELVILEVPVTIVVLLEDTVELEGLVGVIRVAAGFIEFGWALTAIFVVVMCVLVIVVAPVLAAIKEVKR
jgi:hypothetical protein